MIKTTPGLSWVPEWNQSKWAITITAVVDLRITFRSPGSTIQWHNPILSQPIFDLFSGGSNGQNYMFFVYPSLSASDPFVSPTANGLLTRPSQEPSHPGRINHINFSSTISYWDVFLDKKTGSLIELSETYLDSAGTFNLKLAETSLWSVTAQPDNTTNDTAYKYFTNQPSISPTPTVMNTTPSPTIPEFLTLPLLVTIIIMTSIAVLSFAR